MSPDSKKPARTREPPPVPAKRDDADRAERSAGIGESLRHIYDDVLSEEMPEIFNELLRKLG